jgi:NADH dehydrogenase
LRRHPDLDVTVLNPTDYFLYLPLLPEVAGGLIDPRRVAVSVPGTLPGVDLRLGTATGIDLERRHVAYRDAEGGTAQLPYDVLLLTTGSTTKLLPVPGVSDHAHGFRSIAEALYLRDHVIGQVELAASATVPAERDARLTFVVVGAGYTGTEVTAQGVRLTDALVAERPSLRGHRARWILVDTAATVLPGLDPRLSRTTTEVLRGLGVEVRTGTSVAEASADGVRLSDGTSVGTRTLVWSVGVRPDDLGASLGLPTDHGRLVVDEHLAVPGQQGVWACGDVAAVPDRTRPGHRTAMTAQHAQRQGVRAADNIAASLGHGRPRPYRHRDLGFIVDLGGRDAAANPLGVHLSGLPAKTVARGYHLYCLPGNRVRTAVEWATEAVLGRSAVGIGLVEAADVPLDSTQPGTPGS